MVCMKISILVWLLQQLRVSIGVDKGELKKNAQTSKQNADILSKLLKKCF